ncbi:MAG: cytochrome c oxidase cbb3-type subunit 1 [Verrucomicrobiales bacterium]|jgi:cytochrome c oxidase cbb3-type subunit 1
MTSESTVANQSNAGTAEDHLERAAIDRSTRLPVVFFLTSGVAWLAVSIILGIIASIKQHSPGFLDWDWLAFLNFGRVQPAFINAFVYGWCFQVGIAVALWIMARLSRVELKNPVTLIVAGHLWNLGVVLGVGGILAGQGYSLEFLEFPKLVWPLLFVAYTAISVWMVIMFQVRKRKDAYVAQWYILAACFWFPWIYLTANMMIHVLPVPGVMKAAVGAWYRSTLIYLFFVPLGLASSYFMIPKIVGRSIYSYGLSMVAFWTIAGVGAWTGLQKFLGGPLPSLATALSGAGAILMLIPVVAIAINHFMTVRGNHGMIQYSPTLRFTFFGAIGFSMTCLVGAFLSFYGNKTSFTIAEDGFNMIALYFFFSMMMFGAIYFILPRIVGCEWLSRRMIQMHFWPSAYGAIGLGVWLVAGGIWQGVSLDSWDSSTISAAGTSSAFLIGKSFIWIFFISLSNLVFIFHFLMMLFRLGRRTHEPTLLGHPGQHGGQQTLAEGGAGA